MDSRIRKAIDAFTTESTEEVFLVGFETAVAMMHENPFKRDPRKDCAHGYSKSIEDEYGWGCFDCEVDQRSDENTKRNTR